MTANPHGFTLNHTMLRVKDPEKSLEFYCGVLGMTLLRKTDIEAGEFSLYFLGFTGSDDEVPTGDADATEYVFSRQGVLELTHNWGTEEEDGWTPARSLLRYAVHLLFLRQLQVHLVWHFASA